MSDVKREREKTRENPETLFLRMIFCTWEFVMQRSLSSWESKYSKIIKLKTKKVINNTELGKNDTTERQIDTQGFLLYIRIIVNSI